MSETTWLEAGQPATLLALLEEQGQQRRLRLLACRSLEKILRGPGSGLFRLPRMDDPATGWPALLAHAEDLADTPDDTLTRLALRRLRTALAIDCQALGRLLVQMTSQTPLPRNPGDPPPLYLLPRLLLVAMGSLLLLPPSPLAEATIDAELFGEPLPVEIDDLPSDHPRLRVEAEIALRMQQGMAPPQMVQAYLEGLLLIGVNLLVSADDGPNLPGDHNLATVLAGLRVESPEEMAAIVQGAGDVTAAGLRDLLQGWAGEMANLARTLTGSIAQVQAQGLAFLEAALTTLAHGEEWSIDVFRRYQLRQADEIRAVAGNPYRTPVIDSTWIRRDDGRVGKLAAVIYAERRWDDLPILGDALEEAGCAHQPWLDALHASAVPHRAWWLLDALRLPGEE